MEYFGLSQKEDSLHIEGVPDAVKLVKVKNEKSRRLAHLALHKSDLEFAASCLQAINTTDNEIVRLSLWRSAVIFYIKCFTGKSQRSQIHAAEIYKNDKTGLEVFQYFKNLRDKHFVHDENAFSQATPSAAINSGNKTYKVEKIIIVSHHVVTLCQENFSNLSLLISKALDWLISKSNFLFDSITKELEEQSYDSLFCLSEVSITVAETDKIGEKRQES